MARKMKTMDGNHAAAHASYAYSPPDRLLELHALQDVPHQVPLRQPRLDLPAGRGRPALHADVR